MQPDFPGRTALPRRCGVLRAAAFTSLALPGCGSALCPHETAAARAEFAAQVTAADAPDDPPGYLLAAVDDGPGCVARLWPLRDVPRPGSAARAAQRLRSAAAQSQAAVPHAVCAAFAARPRYNAGMLTFSLQSGSNGNCIYVEAAGARLLFDAGISGRQANLRMAEHQRNLRDVQAVILSHRHGDHTRCVGAFNRIYHIPVYATPATRHAISGAAGVLRDVTLFEPGQSLTFGAVTVHTLPTPHDAAESVAFIVECEGRRLGICTDLGHPFLQLMSALGELDAVYLESNYDPGMLANGDYPPELKARIRGDGGHLSNEEAAALLRACPRGRLQWAALAHLSAHNNDPDLALETHRRVLGREFPLRVASRYRVSEAWTV
jgi:phosphoribosyl 1,2-cyclic phosphodiesterase